MAWKVIEGLIMGDSETCIHDVDSTVMAQYETRELGIPLLISKSVHLRTCKHCGQSSHFIPYPDRLIAAAAVGRAKVSAKLTGNEIRFLRKALAISAKDLSNALGVAAETFSRWENDKAPMNPATEKMLRIYTGIKLGSLAPAVEFNPEEIINMSIKGIRGHHREIVLHFELVRFKNAPEKPTTDAYTEEQRKVA
jgi:putative zinc finger/helix-turn-helix YgiT family protein